jgi:hypothetical protein
MANSVPGTYSFSSLFLLYRKLWTQSLTDRHYEYLTELSFITSFGRSAQATACPGDRIDPLRSRLWVAA